MEVFGATTDIWSRSNKSFLAVSVHYFKGDELKTQFIACDSFPGRHTNDKVAAKLNTIFDRFGILNKVFFVTSDNAGEYCAAFKYYGDNYDSVSNLVNQKFDWSSIVIDSSSSDDDGSTDGDEEQSSHGTDMSESDSCESDSEDETDYIGYFHGGDVNGDDHEGNSGDVFQVFSVFQNEDESGELYRLLPNSNRISCSSHMLDKLGKNDSKNAEKDPVYGAIHKRVFGKLEKIWALKESRLSAEIFTSITGKKLIGPHRIRWLKTFDAVIFLFLILNYD